MAEAFGIAGSAFGTVSLGLQLFKEVSQYLDDIGGREEDLKEARSYATNIQLSLDALNVAISTALADNPETKRAIESCKASCVSAVDNLLAVVKELRGPTISVPNSNASRAKELCAKLKYPFKKQTMEKLEDNLSRTNSALQTMLQVFQLNTGFAAASSIDNMHQAVADLHVISGTNKATLDRIHKTSQVHDDRLSTIQQDIRELLFLTRDSGDTKLLLKTMAQQVSDLTSRNSIDVNLLHNSAPDKFIPSIQKTSYQSGGSMTCSAFCSCKTQRVRYSQRHWGPFLLEAEVRSRDHHAPECPMSKLAASTRRTKRALSLLIPTIQKSRGHASRVSLSFTTGAGILGFGQTVAWVATVNERLSPAFQLVDTIARYSSLPRKEMDILLASCFRRLVYCYANSYASATDVNEDGETILGWALDKYANLYVLDSTMADNMAEIFQMLNVIAEPTSCSRNIVARPIPILIGISSWFFACKRPGQVATTILSKCNEPIGHHHHHPHSNLSWHGNEYPLGTGYRLFQAFEQLGHNLEFGPLTQAVLKYDRNGVKQLLERCPTYIRETNYCGQSPVHLAIETQNIAIISEVLHYADAKALRARDNRGYYPIDYVTEGTWTHRKASELNCKGCEVLKMLLRLDTALFPTSLRLALRPSWTKNHNCLDGRKILIRGLAERRERLKELSYQCLSPAERNGLEVHQTRILDHNAARVQQQLEAQGCSVPTHLSVYEEVVGPLCGYESIYLLIFNGELAEFAHKLGFSYSDNDLADLMCRLASRLNDGTYATDMLIDNLFPSSYFCWMIDHGMRVASKVSSGKLLNRQLEATAAHYFMASYGRFAGISLNIPLDCPLSLAAIEIVFSAAVVDRCRCWCSPGGCTPLVKLLEEVWRRIWSPGKQSLSKATERLIYDLVSANCGKTSEHQWIHAAIIRYFTFSMLGLRHVCCSIIGNESGALPEEEFQEIEEENSSLLRQFENLLTEFEDGRRHQMGLEEFFKWMDTKWAPRMKEVRAELASERLTDEQLRGAESIGVVWRVYGPQPEGKAWQPARWKRRDVWDYMDELDKIATDPERPMKESRQSHK